eukprot:5468504-Prymnesium_polylepis.1
MLSECTPERANLNPHRPLLLELAKRDARLEAHIAQEAHIDDPVDHKPRVIGARRCGQEAQLE